LSTSDGASCSELFTLLLLLHLAKCPTTQRALGSALHISIGFWSWRFHGSGTKKWQGNVVRESPKVLVWEADKTHVGGGNISEAQKICNRIPHLELVDRGKGKTEKHTSNNKTIK
jgi:hypothetical protein